MNIELLNPLFPGKDLPALGPARRPSALAQSHLNANLAQFATANCLSEPTHDLLRSALLLWHDHLDASHALSQDMHSADGSFLHAIMHRREPDYWNSKYWWRRVGDHPAFQLLSAEASKSLAANAALAKKLLPGGRWDPFAYVDAVEAGLSSNQDLIILQQLQLLEMRAFLQSLD